MIITCPSCSHTDDVDDSLIPANAVRVVCKQCGHRFPLSRPAAAVPPPFTGAAGAEKTMAYYQVESPVKQASTTAAGTAQEIKAGPVFHGKGEQLFIIYLLTIILSSVTMGIYYFWGKTKIREYIYGQTELLGDRLQYTGTGLELFIGGLKAFALLMILVFIPQNLAVYLSNPYFIILALLGYVVIIPLATVGAQRYRLTRTTWQGIKFSFTGTISKCFQIYILGYLLIVLTFSLYYPYYIVRKQAFLRNNTQYGSTPFKYDGRGTDLLLPWVFVLLFSILSSVILNLIVFVGLGLKNNPGSFLVAFTPFFSIIIFSLGMLWFKAKCVRYNWEHTTFENIRFKCSITPRKYIIFEIANTFILIFTAWIAYPWVLARRLRFNTENLSLEGSVDFEKVRQTAQKASATGEGLLDSFEMDFGLGI